LGFTPTEMMDFSLEDLFPPENVELLSNLIKGKVEEYKNTGVVPETKLEIQQYHKKGHLVWVEFSARIIANKYGELSEIIGITRSIEDRKNLELALKESEEKYKLVTENLRDII
jgi:PAS domain S-box-containing protein